MTTGNRSGILVLAAGVMMFAVFLGWMTYEYGRYRAGFDKIQVHKDLGVYKEQLRNKQQQIETMRDQLARLESAQKVDAYSTKAVKDAMEGLQQENQALREELQFYRGIVSPGLGRAGIHIQNFKLDQGDQEGQYRFKLTLIHIQGLQKHHREASGTVQITITGDQKGVPRKLTQAEILPKQASGIHFRLRYFGRFEGRFVLPSGFSPRMIRIEVKSRNSGITGAEKEVQWPLTAS